MLILTREIGQRIFVNDDIEFIILGVSRKQVKVGIKAPKEYAVHREEVYARVQNDKLTANMEINDNADKF